MHMRTKALVLRAVDYKESDKILTLLTQESGKLTASARGCRKKGSPVAAGVQLLAWSDLVLYEYRGRWTVKEAAVEREFLGLRRDVERLALACYFAEAAEALAVIHAKDESNVESIHEDLRHQILDCKDVHKVDSSTDNMDFFNHMPRFLGKFLVWILTRLDIHGWIPASIIETDPYYTTCVISNLGSIKLNCGYHHLTNWGTCSVFCIIGEKSKRPVYHEDGTIEMREMLDLGLTIDERLADGYYYSKTIRLLKKLLENPELLETPANQEVEY